MVISVLKYRIEVHFFYCIIKNLFTVCKLLYFIPINVFSQIFISNFLASKRVEKFRKSINRVSDDINQNYGTSVKQEKNTSDFIELPSSSSASGKNFYYYILIISK